MSCFFHCFNVITNYEEQTVVMTFANRKAFHDFLLKNHDFEDGIWITFHKHKESDRLTPNDALLEALAFGWIDGQIKKSDDDTYIKYFKKRSTKSVWSTRNKGLVSDLIKEGLMMPSGLYQMELAKKDGRWEKADSLPADFSLETFEQLVSSNPIAYQNFLKMSPSIRKTYAVSYYWLKKPESRANRLEIILNRLEKNLKPM